MTELISELVLIVGQSQEPNPPILELFSLQIFEIEDDTPTLSHKIAKPEVLCLGYELKLPESQSPFVLYLFLLHTMKDLPWKVVASTEKLVLWSN